MEVSGLAKARREWLAENEPEYLHERLQTNQIHKLEKALDQAVASRLRYALESVIAGGRQGEDGRSAPKPLPEKEKMEIYSRLMLRDEAQQRARTPRQQKQKSREN